MPMRLSTSLKAVLAQVQASLTNTSVINKAISVILIIVYLLSYIPGVFESLAMIPEKFWPPNFYVWTAFTHCFIEVHLWLVIVDLVVIILAGKLLEPLWGAFEMVIFFFAVNIGVSVTCSFFYYLLYMMTYNTTYLFEVHIHGMSGYLAGITVAVRQVMPDHIIYRSPIGKITNRNIPLLILFLSLILLLLNLVEGSFCSMFGSGIVISWIYLRFYQVHSNGSRGDMTDSFAFHTFFPSVLQPPIAALCNMIFAFLVKIRVCSKPIRKYDMGSSSSSISISLPGSESHDTERRRQKALKALSERLNKAEEGLSEAGVTTGGKKAPEATSWPSLDEEEEAAEGTKSSRSAPDQKLESVHASSEVGDSDRQEPKNEAKVTKQDQDVSS